MIEGRQVLLFFQRKCVAGGQGHSYNTRGEWNLSKRKGKEELTRKAIIVFRVVRSWTASSWNEDLEKH